MYFSLVSIERMVDSLHVVFPVGESLPAASSLYLIVRMLAPSRKLPRLHRFGYRLLLSVSHIGTSYI